MEKDAARGVALLRQVATQDDAAAKISAQSTLAACYMAGIGVEAGAYTRPLFGST